MFDAIDEAKKLYGQLKSGVGQAVNFVKQNPTPAGYVAQQVKPTFLKIGAGVKQAIPKIQQQAAKTPILPFVPQSTPKKMTTFQAPLERQTANLPSFIQSGFPIVQVPSAIGEQVRSTGRILSGKPNPLDLFQIGVTVAGLRPKEIPQTNKAIELLRGKLMKQDVDTIGKFAELVETGKGKQDMGELGKTIHSLARNVFGKEAETWSNQKLKNVFDLVLGKIGQGPNTAGLGLSVKNIREGVKKAPQTSKAPGALQGSSQIPEEVIQKSPSSTKIIPQVINPENPYFNVNKLNLSSKAKQVVKTEIEGLKPQIEKVIGKKLSNDQVIAQANQTAKVLRKVVPQQETLNWEASMLKARQTLAEQAKSGTVTQEFIDSLMTIKSQGTDIARKLQSLGIEADPQSVTAKQVMLEAVLKQNNKVDEVLKAAEGVDFNDFQQASVFYRKFIKPTVGDWIDTLRYNAMLSSPNTHMVNISSNLQGTGIIAPIEKTLTGTFDWIGSKVTGKQQKYFAGEGAEYAKGYYSKLGEASKRFSDVMSGKVMGEYPEMRDIPLSAGGKGKAAEAILKFPQRALEAMDQFFTTLTSEGSKKALEYRASRGVNVGDIGKQSGEEAAKRLFRGKFNLPEEGHVLKAIEYIPTKLMEAKNSANPIVKWTAKLSFPFVRIAVNLFKQGVEYSPLGLSTIPGAKEKLPQFTKAFMGAMVGVGASMLASSDRITWAKPTSRAQQDLWDKAGMQEYAVKVGDSWVSYTKLHPLLAFNLATVAGVKQALENQKITDGTADTLLTSLWNVMRFYADQSYVKNIGDFIGATQQGVSSLPKLAANYSQQFVPYRAFMGWLARVLDPIQRETTPDASMIQKQMEYFFMQIPGLRQTLPERTGVMGEPVENKNRFINAFSPSRVTSGDQRYEGAYQAKKNEPKIEEAKRQAIQAVLKNDKKKAVEILKQYNIKLDRSDVKTAKTSQEKKIADLVVEKKKKEAAQMAKEYNLKITRTDVIKAAKRKAIEYVRLGLKKEAAELTREYGFFLSRKDVE